MRPSACAKKQRYRSQADASVSAARRVGKGAPRLRPYPCPVCGGWHLTKQAPTGDTKVAG